MTLLQMHNEALRLAEESEALDQEQARLELFETELEKVIEKDYGNIKWRLAYIKMVTAYGKRYKIFVQRLEKLQSKWEDFLGN